MLELMVLFTCAMATLPNGGGICGLTEECNMSGGGVCTGSYCLCNATNTGEYCDYRRKIQSTAFLLDFFLGWCGAGQFYLGKKDIALSIILFFVFCIIVVPLLFIGCFQLYSRSVYSRNERNYGEWDVLSPDKRFFIMNYRWGAVLLELALAGIVVLVWWTTNWVFIAQGKTKDGRGETLYMNM